MFSISDDELNVINEGYEILKKLDKQSEDVNSKLNKVWSNFAKLISLYLQLKNINSGEIIYFSKNSSTFVKLEYSAAHIYKYGIYRKVIHKKLFRKYETNEFLSNFWYNSADNTVSSLNFNYHLVNEYENLFQEMKLNYIELTNNTIYNRTLELETIKLVNFNFN